MDIIQDVLYLKIKPKEKIDKITEIVLDEPENIDLLMDNLRKGKDTDKGTFATVLKQVSFLNPVIVVPFIDELIEYINHKSNRVKWGIPETIGNLAEKYPERVEKAIPNLLLNTKDESTVVRWCAAYALTNIAIYNLERRGDLVEVFTHIVSNEENNGVKNVYLKALKQLDK